MYRDLTLLLLFSAVFADPNELSSSTLLAYDWKSKNCDCKIKSVRQFEASPGSARQKQRPTIAGVLFVEMPSDEKTLGKADHVFQKGSSLLEISPAGNRLKLPVEDYQFSVKDRSSASIRESSLDMNDTAKLHIDAVSTWKTIHSRVVLKSHSTMVAKDHCVMYCEYASTYVDEDATFTVDWFSRVDFRYPHEDLFESPVLTMMWATELVVKEHSQMVVEGGYVEMSEAASVIIADRSKLSLGRYQYSIDKSPSVKKGKPSRLFVGEQSEIKLSTGSHLHVSEGCTLFVDKQQGIHLDGSALHFIPDGVETLVCIVHRLVKLSNDHIRVSKPTRQRDNFEKKGIICETTAEKLSERIGSTPGLFEPHRVQLTILEHNEKDVSLHPLHADPEIPDSYDTFDCIVPN